MKRVGEVVRIAQHLAIVRAPDAEHVDIGTPVVDENLDGLGRVVDVFGPVDRPYLAVTTDDDVHPPALVGTPLYAR
ncbi:H/ACA ribonucleoprotein complex subunit GAR1 [Halosimplex sp. TS25]|uniref:H/ACA ribonucleoprotein complex subunit GAR1 n=1 Tax=Halosimplex rarum TaxID=3396619 RepID=UPI0039EA142B